MSENTGKFGPGSGAKLARVRAALRGKRGDRPEPPPSVARGEYTVCLGNADMWHLVQELKRRLSMPTDVSVVRRALDELEKTTR